MTADPATPDDWPQHRLAWRWVQVGTWSIGLAILVALFVAPSVGLHAFWNVLIPVAPALLVVAPGIWRNVCPMGSVALLARHLGISRRVRVPREWTGRLLLSGVVMLFVIVPLRHVALDTSGPATGLAIVLLSTLAFGLGLVFEWKSAWCSGMCPVHPVERLYGAAPAVSPPNAHCTGCASCVGPCPDSTSGIGPPGVASAWNGTSTPASVVAGVLLVGGFPGFIWGWFQVPDWAHGEGWSHLATAYGWPLTGAAVSAAAYAAVRFLRPEPTGTNRAFAAVAVCCYYWYRLPALFGFGPFPGDGMLVDLRGALPEAFPVYARTLTTVLFAWWLLFRPARAWTRRPPAITHA